LYIFNTSVSAAINGTDGEWLDAADSLSVERAVEGLRAFAPAAGTSLENAVVSINNFDQSPDNIFILTDGLPTQGARPPSSSMVDGDQRRKYFQNAIKKIPDGIPVNTILFPMEGDPEAAALFWQLALNTQGAFIAPSRDWP
jgi:hypothetical protein